MREAKQKRGPRAAGTKSRARSPRGAGHRQRSLGVARCWGHRQRSNLPVRGALVSPGGHWSALLGYAAMVGIMMRMQSR